jgi:hypothetical protein
MDALLQDDAEGVFQRHELMCASCHRARHPKPPNVLGIEFCGRTRQKSKLVENDDTTYYCYFYYQACSLASQMTGNLVSCWINSCCCHASVSNIHFTSTSGLDRSVALGIPFATL